MAFLYQPQVHSILHLSNVERINFDNQFWFNSGSVIPYPLNILVSPSPVGLSLGLGAVHCPTGGLLKVAAGIAKTNVR